MTEQVVIDYYTDILCIWAYIGHRRVEELVSKFDNQIKINTHYCSVFSDAIGKLEKNWASRDGIAGYAHHVQDVIDEFPHVEVGSKVWSTVRPFSSAPCHLFLKAVEVAEAEKQDVGQAYLDKPSVRAAWELRKAFFVAEQDISEATVQQQVCETLAIDYEQIIAPKTLAHAAALLVQDMDQSKEQNVQGSPTFIMNSGRQKLFGNVGFRVLEANIRELLSKGKVDDASWC